MKTCNELYIEWLSKYATHIFKKEVLDELRQNPPKQPLKFFYSKKERKAMGK